MQNQLGPTHVNVARPQAIPVVLNNLAGSDTAVSRISQDRITSYGPVMSHLPGPIHINPGKTKLPADYEPNNWTVLCGKGRDHFNWIGNRRFRVLVGMTLDRYSYARTKAEKTRIVMDVVEAIHESGGHFAKRKVNGDWYDVGYDAAREKVGALFRDMLLKRRRHSRSAVSSRPSPRPSPIPPEMQHETSHHDAALTEKHGEVGGDHSDEQLDFKPEKFFPF